MRLRGSKCIKTRETVSERSLQASVTVEAALALPFMMLIILTFAFLIHILRVHEIVHSSMYSAADQMAIQNFTLVRLAEVYDRNNNMITDITGVGGFPHDLSFGFEEYNKIASRESFLATIQNGDVEYIDIDSALSQIWQLYEFVYTRNILGTNSHDILHTREELFKEYLLHEFYKRANQSYDGGRIDRMSKVNEMLRSLRIRDGFDGLAFISDASPSSPEFWISHFNPYVPHDPYNNRMIIRIRYEVMLPFSIQNIEGIHLSHIVYVRRWGMGHRLPTSALP